MNQYGWWAVIAAVLIGHCGVNIAIYNRVNGFGWPRLLLKSIELVFFLWTTLAPVLAMYLYGDFIVDVFHGRFAADAMPLPLAFYSVLCLLAWIVLGIPWLLWRPIWGLEWTNAKRDIEVVRVQQHAASPLPLSLRCKAHARIPFNQIFELSVEEIELPVRGLAPELDRYRIAHLSDVHLTGHVHSEFSRYAIQRATQWRPDLMALTGDIIDAERCVGWLPEIFAPATAPDGCFFVLGNHDLRIADPDQTRTAMSRAGWTDLGSRTLHKDLGGVPSMLIGNEFPWFARPRLEPEPAESFRLLLSHSPDQFGWARSHRVTLMLAGHTHGGQGRLPVAGPILGPSFHGTRYAAGDFYRPPTTLHVTRGLSGTHQVRLNCRPELSLLTLRSIPFDDDGT